jgi:peptide/nickel transport system permease protein
MDNVDRLARTRQYMLVRVFQHPRGHIGLVILLLFLLCAVFGYRLAPYDPIKMNIQGQFSPPSRIHLLGTDQYGKDAFSNVIAGARVSMAVALVSVTIAIVFGVPLGLVAGYFGSWVDNVIMRMMDVLMAFPALLLAIAIVGFLGPSIINVMIATGIVTVPIVARVARSGVLSAKEEDYVLAAKSIGKSDISIMACEILPNVTAPIMVQATISFGAAIVTEASLSFLGLGTPPPTPSWGRMLSESRGFLEIAPWNALAPGITIMLVVMAVNFLGDALRDVLDPTLRESE